MEFVVREAIAPLPPKWEPGSPLPRKYKLKKVIKFFPDSIYNYKTIVSRFYIQGKYN